MLSPGHGVADPQFNGLPVVNWLRLNRAGGFVKGFTMAGNTRGKLKEHFEGIHRNFDWSLHHINVSLALISAQIQETQAASGGGVDEATIKAIVEKHPLYVGITALGTGIQTLDELSQQVYAKL